MTVVAAKKSFKRKTGGFSLVELLVVASLIMVLIALLLPTMNAVRKRAQTVVCLNNLRQTGQAMMLYAAERGHFPYSTHLKEWADWGEDLIPYLDTSNEWIPGPSWATGLYQSKTTGWILAHETGQGIVNKTTRAVIRPGFSYFTCPSVALKSQVATPPWDGTTVHRYAHDYSCNEYLMPWGKWNNSPYNYGSEGAAETAYNNGTYVFFPSVKPSELQRPGSLILVCDGGVWVPDNEASDTLFNAVQAIMSDFNNDPSGASTRGAVAVTTPSGSDNDLGTGPGWPVYCRHNGLCNALMADGHVQQFRNGEMQRRNFVSKGRTKLWGPQYSFIEAWYP